MGEEIERCNFDSRDFDEFERKLRYETELLARFFKDEEFVSNGKVAGFELEAWLVDKEAIPQPINEQFLGHMNSELVSPELSRFNVELNSTPQPLEGKALSDMRSELDANWRQCCDVAAELDAQLVMIGILPNLAATLLTLENMSHMKRYRALNEQVFRLREGKPLQLDIVGRERISTEHSNVMLESAATSFQIHLQVNPKQAVRYYNASMIASACTVALGANSPFLFGKDLWDETRIPLFEQAVNVGGFQGAARGPTRRVSFGSGYVRDSLMECFLENLDHFPVLLPRVSDDDPIRFDHLRLHNGTIWRWNRPLIGFEPDGTPHLRIEHRVIASGPTVVDMIANAAFYYGLVTYLATLPQAPERHIGFVQARDNFYSAARFGLDAQIQWLDQRKGSLRDLLQNELLGVARAGLQMMDLNPDDIQNYMGIIEDRVRTRQNGAKWLRDYVQRHGDDFTTLTLAYLKKQNKGEPVHKWTFD